jgi:hypothetical protein
LKGLFTKGLFTKGLFTKGLFTKGLFTKGLFTKGLRSHPSRVATFYHFFHWGGYAHPLGSVTG